MNDWPFKGEPHCSRLQVVKCCSSHRTLVSPSPTRKQLCGLYEEENNFLETKNMAPVYDFRHVELDKIGRGKRIVKPPGGECSDIFSPDRSPVDQITPRKTKNYMQSTIFSPESPLNGHGSSPTTPSKILDTQSRLFGSDSEDFTPRKVVNRQRSSIFEEEVDSKPHVHKTTPVRRAIINPITGQPFIENGTLNGSSNGGTPNGTSNGGTPTNGHSNGYNGYTNGHHSPESPMNGEVRRNRIPPGGKSSGIF